MRFDSDDGPLADLVADTDDPPLDGGEASSGRHQDRVDDRQRLLQRLRTGLIGASGRGQ